MARRTRRQKRTGRDRQPTEPSVPPPATGRRPAWEFWLLAAVLLWTFLLTATPMRNTDIWWHLKTGQMILEGGKLPWADWFTFTEPGTPWVDLHWGFQLLVTALYAIGGVDLLVLAKAFLTAVAVAVGWTASGRHLPAWLKATCWILPVICISGRALVRPEMLSLIFLAGWIWLIGRLDRKPGLIWWLPVLQVVWVNCHGLFVLGLVVAAAYGADRLSRQFAEERWGLEPDDASPRNIILFRAGVLVLLACLVNPYFEDGALFPLALYRKFSVDQEFYSTLIGEFRPPLLFYKKFGLRNLYLAAEFGLWVITAASFVWLACQRRISVFRLLLFAAFSHLAWKASRNTSIFAVVSGIVLCANCGDALHLRGRGVSGAKAKDEKRWIGTPATADSRTCVRLNLETIVLVVVLALTHLTGQWGRWAGTERQLGLGEAEAWYAHAAAQFAGRPGFPKRAFVAHIGQAAVYIFHNAPERRVLMDGRLEVCSRETFQLFLGIKDQMGRGDRRWEQIPNMRDQDGNLPVVILDSRTSRQAIRGMSVTPGWRMVFADAAAAVFVEERVAKKLDLPPADPTPLRHPPGTKLR